MESKIKNLTVKLTYNPKRIPKSSELIFGKYFSDHIFTWDYDPEHGWYNPTIQPY